MSTEQGEAYPPHPDDAQPDYVCAKPQTQRTEPDIFADEDTEPLLLKHNVRPRYGLLWISFSSVSFWWHCLIWRIKSSISPRRLMLTERIVTLLGDTTPQFFSPNVVQSKRYNVITIVPSILLAQFGCFLNAFYIGVALSQFIPTLQVGPLFTYVAPLIFVLAVTIIKEAYYDYQRGVRDAEINLRTYEVLDVTVGRLRQKEARHIRVGHILRLHANQHVPCDVILLRAPRPSGTTFIRTDQLDGETDWKLRRPVAATQSLDSDMDLVKLRAWFIVEPPRQDIYGFTGNIHFVRQLSLKPSTYGLPSFDGSAEKITVEPTTHNELHRLSLSTLSGSPDGRRINNNCQHRNASMDDIIREPVLLENVIWGSTVVASGPIWALAIYTGADSRAALNTSKRQTKKGLFDEEINMLSKTLFVLMVVISGFLVFLKGLTPIWFIHFSRFILLLSSIIPISLRVNLDLAKAYYGWTISSDGKLESAVVRNSSMPEELGRIDVLLTDKTGTLTQNDMVFKKLHVGHTVLTTDDMIHIRGLAKTAFSSHCINSEEDMPNVMHHARNSIRNNSLKFYHELRLTLIGLGVCHNVTPIQDEFSKKVTFQASSADDVAILRFVADAGLKLVQRTDDVVVLVDPYQHRVTFDVLFVFPFTWELKRAGCIVRLAPEKNQTISREPETGRIFFFLKGAESAIIDMLTGPGSRWLQEECDNFARTGLRTLALAVKELTHTELDDFAQRYLAAHRAVHEREQKVRAVVQGLENNMALLCVTGVEDKLQENVPVTLEAFRHAGIQVWMLTGDKVETAICVAISSGLKRRQHSIVKLLGHHFTSLHDANEAIEMLALGCSQTVLVVDGPFVDFAVNHFPISFFTAASQASAVICCRCSPTQKAVIARLIQMVTGKRTAAVGDGGNDVSLIRAANFGISVMGKEGDQAALAADISVKQFCNLRRLVLWHGRNCYQRSAKLAHFIMHRGLIIATIQVVFSSIFYFIPLAIFQGWLTVGYATYYTMLPVFSLVLDTELAEPVVFMFPELYSTLRSGRVMSLKTFFSWLLTSVYQGIVIMLGAVILFESELVNIVSIVFTSLILAELLNVASTVTSWHFMMLVAEITTILIYIVSMSLLPRYFNLSFISTAIFWWKVCLITTISWFPVLWLKMFFAWLQPTRDSKLVH